MPLQAFWLKKYRASTGPVSSIEESEHTTAPLRHSEELRIQHAPFDEPVRSESNAGISPPTGWYVEDAPSERPNHDSKISSAVCGEGARDVLPQEISGAAKMSSCMEYPHLFVEQSGAFTTEAALLTGHTQVLAGRTAHHQIQQPEGGDLCVSDLGYVAQVWNAREPMLDHRRREGLDLSGGHASPTHRLGGNVHRADPVK